METMTRSTEPSRVTARLRGRGTARRKGHRVTAGVLLTSTGIGIIMSIITNEALYPQWRHYSTFANSISDLGGTLPPNSYMVQPNRTIFIATMAVGGVLVLAATYLLWPVIQRRRIVAGLGASAWDSSASPCFPATSPVGTRCSRSSASSRAR